MSEKTIDAWLNGRFLPISEATVGVLDRGFLFGDSVYEMLRVVRGELFLWPEHRARLERGLSEMRILGVDPLTLREAARALLKQNHFQEASVYFQISRGMAPTRSHAFPVPAVVPTQLVYATPFQDKLAAYRESGASVISFPELRWGRCSIKSTNLLGNVFAAQAAKEKEAVEAVFVTEDGGITEGSHTNFFGVIDGKIRTMPKGSETLPGVTRDLILALAKKEGLAVEEKAVNVSEIDRASELFITGTSTEVLAIATWDGKKIGSGKSGPVAGKLRAAYTKFREEYPHSRVKLGMGAND